MMLDGYAFNGGFTLFHHGDDLHFIGSVVCSEGLQGFFVDRFRHFIVEKIYL